MSASPGGQRLLLGRAPRVEFDRDVVKALGQAVHSLGPALGKLGVFMHQLRQLRPVDVLRNDAKRLVGARDQAEVGAGHQLASERPQGGPFFVIEHGVRAGLAVELGHHGSAHHGHGAFGDLKIVLAVKP